MVVLGS